MENLRNARGANIAPFGPVDGLERPELYRIKQSSRSTMGLHVGNLRICVTQTVQLSLSCFVLRESEQDMESIALLLLEVVVGVQ